MANKKSSSGQNSRPYINPLCNNQPAVDFIKKMQADCKTLSDKMDVPVENILGLVAQESQWGMGRIAKTYNNYFSMHSPAPFQSGDAPALGSQTVRVATFDSFLTCGKSFLERFGNSIRGVKDPKGFAKALVKANFNTGNSKTGGRDDFEDYLVTIIKNVKVRMDCQ